MTPTAIVGISARLPSGVSSASDLNHDSFFEFLLRGGESYERIPVERFNIDAFCGTSLGTVLPDKGSFLKGIDLFDPVEFGVTAKDAKLMAVSTRVLLEQSFLALLDAGIEFRGKDIGCFMAGVSHDLFMLSGQDEMEAQGSFAYGPAMVANRVSYHLDLRGPSIPIDTACSSSLTATHLAIHAIAHGECETALVGGCQLNLRVVDWMNYSQGGVLSKDGKCKPFDAQADGFARGEGAVVIVLKRLDAAIKDGDKIYATVLGTAINSSGSAVPVNAPYGPAQEAAMHEAFRRAQRKPSDVDFVELHATGTARGDPTEANWVGDAFSRDGELLVGSVKGNIGHLEITAFLASLSKVCSILRTRRIPPNVNLSTRNPAIQWDRHRMRVPICVEPLSSRSGSGKSLVSLTSSGIGGANGHCVVESGPDAPPSRAPFWRGDPPAQLLIAGALSPRAVSGVLEHVTKDARSHRLADVALTYNRRARSLTWRSFAVMKDNYQPNFTVPRLGAALPPQIVYVFSGQGPQHRFMGKDLFDQCIPFRQTVLELDELYEQITGRSLLSYGLFGALGGNGLGDIWPIAVTLPALTVFQLALFDTLVSIGVKPDALVGHSAGEVAVLYASGAGSKALALEVSIARGEAMSLLEQHSGTMAAVNCAAADAERIVAAVIDELGPGALEIACYNADDAVTLSGSIAHVDAAVSKAKSLGLFAQRLRTRVPVHSTMMELCRDEYCSSLQRAFARHSLAPCVIPVYSSATGLPLDRMLDPDYFWMNSRGPVRFDAAIRSVMQGLTQPAFVEVSPHPVLTGYISALAGDSTLATCPARRPPSKGVALAEAELFLASIGELCALGCPGVDFKALAGAKSDILSKPVDYPFSYKVIPPGHLSGESARFGKSRRGPLNYDNMRINQETHPSLADHIIKGEAIMPGSGYVEMALEYGARVLWNVEFLSIIPLGKIKPIPAAIELSGSSWVVRSSSQTQSDIWPPKFDKIHASGCLALSLDNDSARPDSADLMAIARRCVPLARNEFYPIVNRFGYGYGPQYQRIEEISVHRDDGGVISEALVRVRGYAADLDHDPAFVLHPAILDAAIHAVAHPFLSGISDPALYALPAKIRSLITHEALYEGARPETFFSHLSARSWTPYSAVWDCVLYDSRGRAFCTLDGLEYATHGHSLTTPCERHFELTCAPRNIGLAAVLQDDSSPQIAYVFSIVEDANSSDFVVAFRHGSELQLQSDIAALDELQDVTIWLTAPTGEHGDALFGFARAFRREVLNWRVFSITHATPLSLAALRAVVCQLKTTARNEPDLMLDENGRVHYPKLAEHPAAALAVPFDHQRPWRVLDGRIHHFDPAPPQRQEAIIEVDVLSPGPGPLRGFVGRRRPNHDLVVGVTTSPPTSVIRCSGLSVTRLPDDFQTSYRRLPVASMVICALVFGRRLLQQRNELCQLSVMVIPCDSDIGAGIVHILSSLGLPVAPIPSTASEYDVVMRHQSSVDVVLCGDVIPTLISAAASCVSTTGTTFSWEGTVASTLRGKPWLIGEALNSLFPLLVGKEMPQDVLVSPTEMLPVAPSLLADQALFDSGRTYLLVGGIGSLGLYFANWMYENGARSIILTSRSGKASVIARNDVATVRLLAYLESHVDLVLQLHKADAADESDMHRVIYHAPSPPAGCLLLSGLLVDGAFRLHSQSSYEAPFQSKVDALRVLQRVLKIESLDWFIATSSVTALFGNAGQTNYASANSMMHGLLHPYRNASALIVPFITDSSVASARDSGRMKQLSDWGFTSRELCVALGDCILGLRRRPIGVYVPDFNWRLVAKHLGRTSLFSHLLNESEVEGGGPDRSDTLEARIMSVLDVAVEDFSGDVPLTAYGLDSLSAARLAYVLKPILPVTQMQLLAGVSSNDLRRRLDSAAQHTGEAAGQSPATHMHPAPETGLETNATSAMLAALQNHSSGLRQRPAAPSNGREHSRGHCVLLTGTTGSLGCALLTTFATIPGVKIYAVNRPNCAESILQRQKTALEKHGYKIPDDCFTNIVFVETTLQDSSLGIADGMLRELQSSVTTIIHNAWPVNFNAPLAAFDGSLMATRNLVNLALQSTRQRPPRVIFISTFSTLLNANLEAPARETASIEPSDALGNGYTESKWIAERILEAAAADNPEFQPVTIRVGTICGAPNGAWDRAHWVPSIISAGKALGYLPVVEKDISWIPLDAAAKAIADAAFYSEPAPKVLHLVHPRPVQWSDIFNGLSALTGARLIPYSQWVTRLERLLVDGGANMAGEVSHALRLLDFFHDRQEKLKTAPTNKLLGDAYDGLLFPRIDMTEMLRVSPSLREVRPLDASDVETWLDNLGLEARISLARDGGIDVENRVM